jgi:hypothetical protein
MQSLLDRSRRVLAAFEAGRRHGLAPTQSERFTAAPTVQRTRRIDEAVKARFKQAT